MTESTRIVHEDYLIPSVDLQFIPESGCLVGDFLEYELLLPEANRGYYQKLKGSNVVHQIMEREIILRPDEQVLVLFISSKPAF